MAPLAFRRRDRLAALQRSLDFIREISPQDNMLGEGPEEYYRWGVAALDYIQVALRAAEYEGSPRAILDLPCGHGRVLRMLRAAYPEAAIHACDIKRDAVEFCARVFRAKPILSSPSPEDIELPGRYDLIWVGSLLTHVGEEMWHRFLRLFSEHLKPSGVLVFTTLGRTFARELREGSRDSIAIQNPDLLLKAYDSDAFAYQDFVSTPGYGIAMARPKWVCETLERYPDLDLICYTEDGWKGREDAVACRRATVKPQPT
jgi:SAM-dependent methyltransferase